MKAQARLAADVLAEQLRVSRTEARAARKARNKLRYTRQFTRRKER